MSRLLTDHPSVSVTSPAYLDDVFREASANMTDTEGTGPRFRATDICARVRAARLEAGFTQEDMADYLGVSVRTYRFYEKSRVPPNKYWAKLELVTGRPERWFLFGDEGDPNERLDRLEQQVVGVAEQLSRVLLLLEGRTPGETGTNS